MDTQKSYEKIRKCITTCQDELVALSTDLHEHPEMGFHERHACAALTTFLEKNGFSVKTNVAGLETAFVAEVKGNAPGPTVAFLAEYDALPIGHACGHNLIATMSCGAAAGIVDSMRDLPGRVLVIGTPAEEGGGGKIIMCDKGVFNGVDCAMMIHPHKYSMVMRGGLAVRNIKIEYHGRSTHSSRPEEGINALDAVLQTFALINSQRPLFPIKANVNGIILNGGKASNVIPDEASCDFCVRAETVRDLNTVVTIIEKIVHSIDSLVGTTSTITRSMTSAERYPNRALAEDFKLRMESLGEKVSYPPKNMKVGSSDIGNVSLIVPSIQAYLRVSEYGTHTPGFEKDAVSAFAHEQMIKGAQALAMTAYDFLTDADLRARVRLAFEERDVKYTPEELKQMCSR